MILYGFKLTNKIGAVSKNMTRTFHKNLKHLTVSFLLM